MSGHVSTWNRAKPESGIPSVAVTVFIAWKANACSEWDEEPRALNPFLLHSGCKDAWEPINDFHFIRPTEGARKCPWAINEQREIASMWMSMEKVWFTILIQVKADLGQRFLVSSAGRALHRYRRGHGFKSRTGLIFFSGLIFTTAWVLFITARVTFVFTPLSAVQIYDLHIFTVVYIYGVVKPLHIYIYHIPLSIYLFIIYQYRGLACQVNQFFFRQIRRSVSSATQINKCLQWILDEKFLKEIHCCFGGGH